MQYNHLLHWFPCKSQGNIAYRIFNVLFLIIRMSPICLQSKQGLRVCALYLTKIDVNKINLTQTKTGMCTIRFTPSSSSPLNLLPSHLRPFLIIFYFTSPLLVSLPRFIYTLYFIGAPCHHLRNKNKSLQEHKASGVETKQANQPQVQFHFQTWNWNYLLLAKQSNSVPNCVWRKSARYEISKKFRQ